MKQKSVVKHLLSVCLCTALVLICLFGLKVNAHAATTEDLTYEIGNGYVTITDCSTDASGELIIPHTIEGNPVTRIDNYAFSDCTSLTSVTIPDGVISVGQYAFSNCTSLTSVTIPNSVTAIGQYAFSSCSSLTSINIPDGVTGIPAGTFEYCSSLTSVTIPNSVTYIYGYAFANCSNLLSITLSDSLTSIGYCMFYNCSSLISVTIPNSVTSVNQFAFYNCSSLTSVTIPNSVTSIDANAFTNCTSLTSVTIPNSVSSIDANAFSNCTSLTSVTIPDSVISIGSSAFGACTNLSSVCFGNSLATIGKYAFSECSSLTSVIIPNSVNSIGKSAFCDCTSLSSVDIPDGITSIEEFTFNNCSSLTSVIIPDSVISIGYGAFGYCSNLVSVSFGNSLTTIGEYAFGNCSGLTSVIIPDSVTSIEPFAFTYCISLSSVSVGENVTSIGNNAFDYCFNLKSINIPDSVTSIGDLAFNSCGSLSTITLPNNTTHIGEFAFQSCRGLTEITIPNNLSSISTGAFSYCVGLTSVHISESVTSIGESAFEWCSSLRSITIPKSVTSVGNRVFAYCGLLSTVTFDGDAPVIAADTFPSLNVTAYYPDDNDTWTEDKLVNYGGNIEWITYGENEIPGTIVERGTCGENLTWTLDNEGTLTVSGIGAMDNYGYAYDRVSPLHGNESIYRIVIENGITSIGDCAFQQCSNLVSVEIPDSITTIGKWSFLMCSSLTSVQLPNSVTKLYYGAFEDCTSLTSINISASLTQFDAYAFNGCTGLNGIWVDENNPNFSSDDTGVLFNKDQTHLIRGINTNISYTIPHGVTTIEERAFYNCNQITSVSFPESIASIDYLAFDGCSNLNRIYFYGNAPQIELDAFSQVTATAYYPIGNTTWNKNVFHNYDGTITWVPFNPLKITAQPKTAYAIIGDTVKTTVKASGDGLTYQWYIKDVGDSKYVKSSIKKATYSCKMSETTNGRYAKCKITDQYGNSVWTNTVRLKMKELAITTEPVSKRVKDGTTAKFTVKPNGTNVTYQWQYRTSSSGSWKTAKATGNTTATLSVPASVSRNGYQYRCSVTDSTGNKVYTKTVTLNVLGIKTQPVSKTVVEGKTAKFTVTATGSSLKYQWQYRTSSSGSWKTAKATGNTTKTLSVPASVSRHGYQYRCKITDSAGNTVYTKAVSLYVLGIKTQPASKTVKVGATAKFTVKATGKGLTYQWQYKTPDGSWKNVTAATGKKATYSLTAAARHNGYQYRCRIKDSAGNVIYTKTVKLTVKK